MILKIFHKRCIINKIKSNLKKCSQVNMRKKNGINYNKCLILTHFPSHIIFNMIMIKSILLIAFHTHTLI